ncbi:DUF1376 domain-containing protein [Rahnella sp. FC061912-K]|uniref:YdaU family protein n=1 Tax=Rahnella rivi TaxID=2816249 RepID=UPI001C25A5E1|nr:DUF1376 domain-containing protein [Rahnella rivi]MBU9832545.1 DUF1376 domain-containing protein [Rahnella rivi]
MAALPYMQLYVADYLADTPHLTTEEHGAYLLLMFNYWQTGRPLPKSRLAGIAKLSNERWSDVERTLNEFFLDTGSEWVHERIERDLEVVKGAQSQRIAAGNASAAKRAKEKALKNQMAFNDRSTTVQRNSSDRSTNKDTDTDKELKDKTLLSGAGKAQPTTKKNAAGSYPEEFETLWHEYPKREGANPKNKAHSCWKARKLEGVSEEVMLEGTRRYRLYCEMRGQAGTEYVMQAQRFYGKERAFENDWQVNTGGMNHAKNIASTIGNNGESIAERQLRAGREQWAKERGFTGVASVGSDDQNLQHPMDSEEWQSSHGPLGKTDRGYDE